MSINHFISIQDNKINFSSYSYVVRIAPSPPPALCLTEIFSMPCLTSIHPFVDAMLEGNLAALGWLDSQSYQFITFSRKRRSISQEIE